MTLASSRSRSSSGTGTDPASTADTTSTSRQGHIMRLWQPRTSEDPPTGGIHARHTHTHTTSYGSHPDAREITPHTPNTTERPVLLGGVRFIDVSHQLGRHLERIHPVHSVQRRHGDTAWEGSSALLLLRLELLLELGLLLLRLELLLLGVRRMQRHRRLR